MENKWMYNIVKEVEKLKSAIDNKDTNYFDKINKETLKTIVNVKANGETPLMLRPKTSSYGTLAQSRYAIIDAKTLMTQNINSDNSLPHMAEAGNEEIVSTLIENGADISIKDGKTNSLELVEKVKKKQSDRIVKSR